MAELLLSPLLHDPSSHMEIPLRAHPHIPTLPAPCPVRAAIPTSLSWWGPAPHPVPSPPAATRWQWDVRVPSRGAGTQQHRTGNTEVSVARRQEPAGHPATSTCSCSDTRPLLGTLKHVLPSFPLGLSSSSQRPASSCGGGVRSTPTWGSHPRLTPQLPSVPRGLGQKEAMDLPQQPG